jgi:hypothetical protein
LLRSTQPGRSSEHGEVLGRLQNDATALASSASSCSGKVATTEGRTGTFRLCECARPRSKAHLRTSA